MEEKKVPALRFRGFDNAWEQRRLGDIGKARSGIAFPDSEQGGREGIPFFKVSDMNLDGNENEMLMAKNYVTLEQIKAYGWTPIEELPAIFFAKVGAAVMLNRKRLCYRPFLLDNNTMAYSLYSSIWNAGFSKALFETINLVDLVQVGALPSYNASDVEMIVVIIPCYLEQKKLGEYFSQLDHLISLHQRKLEMLKKVKKSMLEKMFPKNDAKVPEVRFSDFTDAWEQRHLGEIVERVTRKNENLESTLPLTISAQYGLIDQNEFFDKRIASKDVSGYFLIRRGEFAYNKSTSTDAPWGAIKCLERYENGVLSTLYIVFRIIDEKKLNSNYLAFYYDTDLWHRGVQAIAAEGARNHGLLNIAPVDFFETTLAIPQDIFEQQKIGLFFKQLDHLISLHQRKLEKLKNIKKSMLEKMFII